MARYRFVQLVRRQTEISSTDPSVIDWVVESVRKYIPSCDTRNHRHDLMGDVSVCELHKLQGKDAQVAEWLPRLLCENGFEPFAETASTSEGDTETWYLHFRQRIET